MDQPLLAPPGTLRVILRSCEIIIIRGERPRLDATRRDATRRATSRMDQKDEERHHGRRRYSAVHLRGLIIIPKDKRLSLADSRRPGS